MKPTITRLITLLSRKSQGYFTELMRPFGLTAAERPFYMALLTHEGITQEQLTSLVGIDKAATARAVKSLERKGFLTRTQDKADRRQNLLYPTDQAKAIFDDIKQVLLRFDSLLTEGIDPQEIEILREALLTMNQNLNRGKQGGKYHV